MRPVLIAIVFVLATFWWWRRPVSRPDGILVRMDPVQVLLEGEQRGVIRGDFTIRPLAGYIIEGRVLGTQHYYSDPVASLAPYDVGLGWGKMSDSAVLRQMKLSQSNRFLFWRWERQPPLPTKEIETHASNNHLVAANSAVARQIAWLKEGELIRLEGSLIEATGNDGGKWISSLRRDDDGNGACEVMWVSKLTKL